MPAMPAISSPTLVAPVLAPSSPSAAAGHFEHEIPFQELQLGKLLGSGSFGDVSVDPPPSYRVPVTRHNCVIVLLQVQRRVVRQQRGGQDAQGRLCVK